MSEQKKKKFSVVFVCTGNTCRSPMAEAMFKQYLKDYKRADITVSSAGLYAERGSVMSENAERALTVLGIKHTAGRKARVFTVSMSLDAGLVVAVSDRHAEECGDGDNIMSFEDFGAHGAIPDPYGGNLPVYLECAAKMRNCFEDILAECDRRIRLTNEPT